MKKIIKIILFFVFVLANSSFITAQHNCDYLILTPDCFLPQFTTWDTALINLQTSRGFHPAIEPILNQTTIADIQSIIAEYYNNNNLNLKYVLLIGNSRHTQISPKVDFADSVFFPFYTVHCDAYWNANGWNVVTDDPYTSNLTSRGPVYLGRVPVNSVTEINNYVSKLQAYYRASVNYSLAKDREILLNLDVDCHNGCRGSLVTTLNNNLINGHIPGNITKEVLNVSQHTNGSDAFTFSLARQLLFFQTLNAGASIMSILSTNWSRDTLGSWFNINSPFTSFTNETTAMPFLIGTNCNVGGVNDSAITDNCMRKLIVCQNGGIIGAIAPTSGTEQHMNGDVLNLFHDLVFQNSSLTYSEILPILKNYLATNFPYWGFYYKSFILFGDPSMYPSIYKHKTAGIITSTTWSGNIVLDNTIVVNNGSTLTILPGTNIYFNNNAGLIVNGNLIANADNQATITIQPAGNTGTGYNYIGFYGSSSTSSELKNVTMTNTNGIKCESSGNVTIENCSILNAIGDGIYISNSSPLIIHNNISNPVNNGIWCLSSPTSYDNTLAIVGNTIIKNDTNISFHQYQGIWIQSTSFPDIAQNIVKGFDYGIIISGGSNSLFYDNLGITPYPNNLLTDNVRALTSSWGSMVLAGSYWDEIGMYNSIHDNIVVDLWCHHESGIEAGFNWFGGGTGGSITDETSCVFDLEDYLSTDPWGNQNSATVKPITNSKSGNRLTKLIGTVSSSEFNLSEGLLLEQKGKINDAITFYKGLIESDQFVRIALSQLVYIKNKYEKNEISDYLVRLSTSNQKYYPIVKKLFGDLNLKNNQFDDALLAYDNVIKIDPSGYDGISARFEKLFAYLNIKKEPVTASNILSEIKGIGSKDEEVLMMIKSTENLLNGVNKFLGKNVSFVNENIPATYELYQNYPNPFNPSSTIKYQIPKSGLVTLKVYDILGREVATLVNENKIEGCYDFTFNASRFPSGVYIYQLKVNDYVSSKKMILLK